MTQEDKELLFLDLCGRLSYKVIFNVTNFNKLIKKEQSFNYILTSCAINTFGQYVVNRDFTIENIKPYLRPMSSMTEKEKEEYNLLANHCIVTSVGFIYLEANELMAWLNKKMFDYRGLIPKGFAIEVTKSNNPYKD